MLVLTRKTNESITISGGIEVMVVRVRGNKVRLGFRAPSNVLIQRKERSPGSVAGPDSEQADDEPLEVLAPRRRSVPLPR